MEKSDEVVYQYIKSVYNTIILKDVVGRYNIRDVALLEKITKFLFDNIGSFLSAFNISKYLKSEKLSVYPATVQNYLSYFTNTYIAHQVKRYDIKGKRLLSINEKYYLNDIGFRHALLGYRAGDIGKILENIVYLELRTRGYNVTVGVFGDYEIDFIAIKMTKSCIFKWHIYLPQKKQLSANFNLY
jgi:predicted AAA+ superfamily ATPase